MANEIDLYDLPAETLEVVNHIGDLYTNPAVGTSAAEFAIYRMIAALTKVGVEPEKILAALKALELHGPKEPREGHDEP